MPTSPTEKPNLLAINITSTSNAKPFSDTRGKIALVEAALNPQTFQSLRELIEDEKLPKDSYMKNILEREIDIQHDLTEE